MRTALTGLKVVDFTQIGAGPTCTMMLADMGADVVKVEAPEGEIGRTLGPPWIGADAALFHAFNRNKRGLVLDLKAPAGVAVAQRLAAHADVVIESMRPGVMARLGLGHEALLRAHPRLVYCSISAYGQTGPYAGRAGVDGILQADTGLMGLIGAPGAAPAKVQAPIVDVVTGYLACIAILAKLRERDAQGQGGHLDVNLMNAALALQQSALASYLANGELPQPMGSAAPYSAPNEALPTQDGWIMLAAYNGERWPRLCQALDAPELLADPRFGTSPQRVAHRPAMRDALAERLRRHSTAHWLRVLQQADILCAPVASYADVEQHPQVAANRMIASVADPELGSVRMPGFPINSAVSAAMPHRAAPRRGEHSSAILREAGYSAQQIAELEDTGVLGAASLAQA
ncbi:CaiB/BaiF CoA transferase family protein [Pseudorhodoferax sp.]|uniref:CaiB/BaiF CoA transferase family protein n=1 Tax=Pseudorhodoferax sp. TaxID=1993553 RepID=UPI002DD62F92|nr:CoA transferase [Pseudorhodoferax sp.]